MTHTREHGDTSGDAAAVVTVTFHQTPGWSAEGVADRTGPPLPIAGVSIEISVEPNLPLRPRWV